MDVEFIDRVGAALGDFLSSKDFRFDEYVDLERSGRLAVIYRSPQCRLAIYYSELDGEVNCLLGAPDAMNADLESGKGWFFFRSLLDKDKNPSIEELLARVPSVPRSSGEQLDEIASSLRQHFGEMLNALPRR